MKFKFVKIKGYDVWGLVIENLDQLKEYAKVVAYPKSRLVAGRLVGRMNHNDIQIEKGGYPLGGHWGDTLSQIADMEIQKPENENMTVMEIKAFITGIMVDPKQKMIESGQPLLTFGFPFSPFTNHLEVVNEKILDTIPVIFVDPYRTEDRFGIVFDVK